MLVHRFKQMPAEEERLGGNPPRPSPPRLRFTCFSNRVLFRITSSRLSTIDFNHLFSWSKEQNGNINVDDGFILPQSYSVRVAYTFFVLRFMLAVLLSTYS